MYETLKEKEREGERERDVCLLKTYSDVNNAKSKADI